MRSRDWGRAVLAVVMLTIAASASEGYRVALPGYRYQFPRDHFNHPEFQTEWWYYTGNVHASDGRRFGFELTFFRQGTGLAVSRSPNIWDVSDVWLAHLALSDLDGHRFFHEERLNRAGQGIAGADLTQAMVWNGNWQCAWTLDPNAPGGVRSQRLRATGAQFSIDLNLVSGKPPVIHGANGVSQKAAGAGRASHYVSLTRLNAKGTLSVEGKKYAVEGLAWMDHEFFTHQLEPDQVGWDWFSLQWDDGSEVMLFRIRRKDGSEDSYSAGTYIDPRGRAVPLTYKDFSVTPGRTWTSPKTGGPYPVEWTVRIPSLRIEAAVRTRFDKQELTGATKSAMAYWEGAIELSGSRNGKPIRGVGYLEMTGYAGPVRMGE